MYKKELRKVLFLLILGVIFTLVVLIGASNKVSDNLFEGLGEVLTDGGLYVLVCTLLYPLGFVYNWRNLLAFAGIKPKHGPADRYYTVAERTEFQNRNLMMRLMMVGLAVALGWIPGVYYAVKALLNAKSQENNQV